MESWRHVFRTMAAWTPGCEPILSTQALQAIRRALLVNDSELIQGATTSPPPLQCVQDWDVEGACLIGYGPWKGDGLKTVAEVEQAFGRICFETDRVLGEPAACRWLLNWFDDTPRDEVRRLLLPEIETAITRRLPLNLKDNGYAIVRIAE